MKNKETIEEAAHNHQKGNYDWQNEKRLSFIAGVIWQSERMYSEEDIAIAFNEGQAYSVTGKLVNGKEWAKTHKKEWLEQFKKK